MEEETQDNTQEKKSGMVKVAVVAGIVIVAAIAGFFLVSSRNSSKPPVQQSSMAKEETAAPAAEAKTETPTSQTGTSADTVTVNLEAGSFYYKPSEIKVKKGAQVKIIMSAKDMMHNFNIDELNVKLPITRAGETNTVEFTADKAGTFEYYCSVGKHRLMGQVGKLIVE